jgi:uncharacterized protein (TIGR02266 family)
VGAGNDVGTMPPHTAAAMTDAEIEAGNRQSDRLTINKEFESFDAFIHEYVTNISKTGVFIKSKSPLPVGTKVNLRFTLIMDDIETIEGTGEVVRVESEPAGMGILFHELAEESRELIARLLSDQASNA